MLDNRGKAMNGLQFTNAQGLQDVLSMDEFKSVELTRNCSFQDYAGRPTYPGDKMPWINIYQHRDTKNVYAAIQRITLQGMKLPERDGYYWTDAENMAMDLLREHQVPRAYWPKILRRSRASVERRAKQMYG
jgi:hypothetical protein